MVSIYKCRCGMALRGSDLRYCPFCGEKLDYVGTLVGSKSLKELQKRGWKLILFRRAGWRE